MNQATRSVAALGVAALGLCLLPAAAAHAEGQHPPAAGGGRITLTAEVVAAAASVGAPTYAPAAAVMPTLLSAKQAWKASGGKKSSFDKKRSGESMTHRNYLSGTWNEHAHTNGLTVALRGEDKARPWLVGAMDEGTGYAARYHYDHDNVYYNVSKSGSHKRSCQAKKKAFRVGGVPGKVLNCTVKIKGSKKYKTRYAYMTANSAIIFAECVAVTDAVKKKALITCAKKVAYGQWKASRGVFAHAPTQAAMPGAMQWDLNVWDGCDTIPCDATGTVSTWYDYNSIYEQAPEFTASVSGSQFRIRLSSLPAKTTAYTVWVDAEYRWAPSVKWTLTIAPPLIAGNRSATFTSEVYGEDDPSAQCYVDPPGGIGQLIWCAGVVEVSNTGEGTFDKIEVKVSSNPGNASGVGNGRAQIDGHEVWFWPRKNGPFVETIQYRLRNSTRGFVSAWATITLTFNKNPNF